MSKTFLSAAALAALSMSAQAAVSLPTPSTPFFQSFDALTTATAASAWVNDVTLPGWHLFDRNGGAISTIVGGDGSSNTGSFYSFGTAASTDRALGGLASGGTYFGSPAAGALAGYIALAVSNDTGVALASFTVGYTGEQWRNGGNATAQTMVLEYGFGSSFGTVASWTAAGSGFDFTSPVTGTTAGAVNGNVAGSIPNLGGTVAVNWAAGSTLWLRWIENNDAGNDHGLAIDNFSLRVTPVPEPGTWALLLAGLGAVSLIARRRA